MKIYRYENKSTGSGPFLSFEGLNPADGKIYNNGYLYGCKSQEELISYMKEYGVYNLENFHIVVYNIPEEEIIIHKRELLFPKHYSPFFKNLYRLSPMSYGRGSRGAIDTHFEKVSCGSRFNEQLTEATAVRDSQRPQKYGVTCHDYIHTSLKILEEITKKSGGVRLREDNILFMLSTRLKDLCNKYGIFIMSATQLNGDYQEAETPDQNLLRGAKAIADKIDFGSILLPVKDKDIESLGRILTSNTFDRPNLKLSVYKNRRGRYKGIYLWCQADLGTCRVKPMFATTYGYEIIEMDDIKIITEDKGAF